MRMIFESRCCSLMRLRLHKRIKHDVILDVGHAARGDLLGLAAGFRKRNQFRIVGHPLLPLRLHLLLSGLPDFWIGFCPIRQHGRRRKVKGDIFLWSIVGHGFPPALSYAANRNLSYDERGADQRGFLPVRTVFVTKLSAPPALSLSRFWASRLSRRSGSASPCGFERATRWPPGSVSRSIFSRSRATRLWNSKGKKRSFAEATTRIGIEGQCLNEQGCPNTASACGR